MSLWTCLVSRELIIKQGWRLVSEREYASEDSYSLITLYQYVSGVAILPESLYYYREAGGSLSHTYKKDTHKRMTEFYQACIGLSDRLEYPEEIRCRLAGLFLSQEIGVMKQIVLADLTLLETYKELKSILIDKMTKLALSQIKWQYVSHGRNVLIWMMKKRLPIVVLILVKAQLMKTELIRILKGA